MTRWRRDFFRRDFLADAARPAESHVALARPATPGMALALEVCLWPTGFATDAVLGCGVPARPTAGGRTHRRPFSLHGVHGAGTPSHRLPSRKQGGGLGPHFDEIIYSSDWVSQQTRRIACSSAVTPSTHGSMPAAQSILFADDDVAAKRRGAQPPAAWWAIPTNRGPERPELASWAWG